LPACTHQRYIDAKHVLIVLENDEPAGYLNWTCTPKGLLRLPQVAIHPDLLRTTLGTKIMHSLRRTAERSNLAAIRLTSRTDLPANLFWPTLGFAPTAFLTPKTHRNKPHIEWTLQLQNSQHVVLAALGHARVSNHALLRNALDDAAYAITPTL
jgi:hypothetical protein